MNKVFNNKVDKALIVIESPFQLLSAFEAISYFGIKDFDLIVRVNGESRLQQQLETLVEKLGFDFSAVKYVLIRTAERKLSDFARFLFFCVKFFFKSSYYNKVFIGNYRSVFLRNFIRQFNNSKVVILDDGNVTIDVQKNFSSKNFYDIFSMFDLKPFLNQNIFKNDFKALRSIIDSKGTCNNTVCFIGPGVVAAGILELEDYIKVLSIIVSKYTSQGKRILYIPHRSESRDEVATVSDLTGVSIFRPDLPIEFLGLSNIKMPTKFCSLYSTALLTVREIYGVDVESYHFDYSGSVYKEEIDSVYNYYKTIISVKSLEDFKF